jgi:hypothetical protein
MRGKSSLSSKFASLEARARVDGAAYRIMLRPSLERIFLGKDEAAAVTQKV